MAGVFKNDKSAMKDRIKVVYICHFSDKQIREKLSFRRRRKHNPLIQKDFAIWNTNAIKQFETYSDVEFHIVFPHAGITGLAKHFTINGISFHCFRPEDDFLISTFFNKMFRRKKQYRYNRLWISNLIRRIKPDLIHLVGAENPYYSLSLLDVPRTIPCLVSLQTLMSVPQFFENYSADKFTYDYCSDVEKKVLKRANYIGCSVDRFKDQVKTLINQDAVCLSIPLATGQSIDISPCDKEFDFVYFANDISKASDWAVEAFAEVVKDFPDITLNISGYYSQSYKTAIDETIQNLGIKNNVFITGPKDTHDEVIRQIKKSRFALLPLKVDLISTTIREALACGLPTISTVTEATPDINNERQAILLADKGDIEGLANQMRLLLTHEELCKDLTDNALSYVRKHFSNDALMKKVHDSYFAILSHYHNNSPIDNQMLV